MFKVLIKQDVDFTARQGTSYVIPATTSAARTITLPKHFIVPSVDVERGRIEIVNHSTAYAITLALGATGQRLYLNGTAQTLSASLTLAGPGRIYVVPRTSNSEWDVFMVNFYAEGEWTPTIVDDSENPSESQTYSDREGAYRRIGNLVWVMGYIAMSSLGSLTTTDQIRIGGLPFTHASVPSGGVPVLFLNMSLGSAGSLVLNFLADDTHALIYQAAGTSSMSAVALSELTASGVLVFNGCYPVAVV